MGRGNLSLAELQGKRVLLVFSIPTARRAMHSRRDWKKFHCEQSEMAIVMISRGEPKENRAKVKDTA